jgi:hypothetical protein
VGVLVQTNYGGVLQRVVENLTGRYPTSQRMFETLGKGEIGPSGAFRTVVQATVATELRDASCVSGWIGEVFKHPLKLGIR